MPLQESDGGSVRRYPCGVDADVEVTCERCPDPDGCIDAISTHLRQPDLIAALEESLRDD